MYNLIFGNLSFSSLLFNDIAITKLFLNPTKIQIYSRFNVFSFHKLFCINLGKRLYVWHLEAAGGEGMWFRVKENKDIM